MNVLNGFLTNEVGKEKKGRWMVVREEKGFFNAGNKSKSSTRSRKNKKQGRVIND